MTHDDQCETRTQPCNCQTCIKAGKVRRPLEVTCRCDARACALEGHDRHELDGLPFCRRCGVELGWVG